jgi:halocyanin-like protein
MSTEEGTDVSRRRFLRATSATAGTAAVAGQATAQETEESGNVEPDFGGWLSGVDGGFQDARGQDEATVTVGAEGNGGNYAFSPAGLWVDPGTTVRYEWIGQGGAHNVVAEQGPASLDSGDPVDATGVEYEFTFEEGGITDYFCSPHKGQDMKGSVAVGEDVPTVTITEDSSILPDTAKALGVAGAGAMAGTLGLAYLFVKYGGTRDGD